MHCKMKSSLGLEFLKSCKWKKTNQIDIRIGPELNVDAVDNIETHSSFICFKCHKKVNKFQRPQAK